MTSRIVKNEYERGQVWWPFPGYENRYEITRDGQVRSKPRYVNSPVAGGQRLIGGRILRPASVKGYLALQPTVDGIRKTAYLHRALATLFVPNPEGKPHVNHIDGITVNNAPENLEWCTHLENMQHAYRTGLAKRRVNGPGERSPAAKLTDEKVRDIKRRWAAGETQKAIATHYGVSKGTIGFITRGETWAHVKMEARQ